MTVRKLFRALATILAACMVLFACGAYAAETVTAGAKPTTAQADVTADPDATTQPDATANSETTTQTDASADLDVTADPDALSTPAPEPTPAVLPADAPAGLTLDSDGYTTEGEYFISDKETGSYHYWSQSLQIHITRHADTSPKVVWVEAQIYARNDTLFHMFAYDDTDIVHKSAHQTVIAQKNHVVFAINGDFAHLRLGWKATAGLLIRNGTVISDKTFTKKATKYPNLDNLALLPDGAMLAFGRNEHTIDDYVAMGAYDLLAFGPVLVHEGVLNSNDFKRYGWERAPRTAIGMITPGHYVAIMVEGRQDESRGWSTTHLAAHMQALGAVEALNLDGGQSATMIFMGQQIIRVGNSKSDTAKPRKATEVLGIGQSDLVQLPETDSIAK